MAFGLQSQVCFLDRLADETLQYILDLVVARDSPCLIDKLIVDEDPSRNYSDSLVSSSGVKDPLMLRVEGFKIPIHLHASQSMHLTDWIFINATSRRIRNLGKESFFRSKTIAMHTELPERISSNSSHTITEMLPTDQALALRYARDVLIVNISQSTPTKLIRLPKVVAHFQSLRRCTLLFGYLDSDNVEWIAVAFALAGQVCVQTRELMTSIGIPRHIQLYEAMGPSNEWTVHQDTIRKFIYPALRVKADLLRIKEKYQAPSGS